MILNGLKYIFAGIMLIGIGLVIFDTVLLPLYVGYDNEHYVPDLRGYDTKEAIKILHSYGFYVEDPIERPYKENEKPDIVLNMSPRQFTKVKEGRAIKLTISGNRNHVKVPNVIGKSERNASFEIKRYRLTIDTIHTEYNTEVPKGYVITQMPKPGDLRLAGYGVILFVSEGVPLDYFIVPKLINLDQSKAEKLIIEKGFQLGDVVNVFQPRFLVGTVMEQSLTPGLRLNFPARIDIRISTDKMDTIIELIDTINILDTLEGNL
jgi:beta-lactam-binding protein with PASTA domain